VSWNRRARSVFRDMPVVEDVPVVPQVVGDASPPLGDASPALQPALDPVVQQDAYFQELKKFPQRDAELQARVKETVEMRAALNTSFGNVLPDDLRDAIAKLNEGNQDRIKAIDFFKKPEEKKFDYVAANASLDKIQAALVVIETHYKALDDRNKFIDRETRFTALVAGINRDINKVPDKFAAQVADFDRDTKAGLTAAGVAKGVPDYATGNRELDKVQKAVVDFQKVLLQAAPHRTSKEKAALRTQMLPMIQDRDVAKQLMNDENMRDLLDELVADFGGSAKNQAAKDFVKTAIMARYDIEKIEGDLSTKALPKLYEVMGWIPLEHTKDNPMLREIERNKKNATSDYGGGKVRINAGHAGSFRANKSTFDQDKDVDPGCKIKDQKVRQFDATTLHEIGHSVDDSMKLMDGHGGDNKYGGWEKHGLDEIVNIGCTKKGFFKDLEAKYPKPFLREYLKEVLITGKDPVAKLADVVVDGASLPSRDDLLNDPGVRQAEEIRTRLRPAPEDEIVANEGLKDATGKIALRDQKRTVAERALYCILVRRMAIGAAVDEALGQFIPRSSGAPDWADLVKHDAVDWAKNVRLVGDNGLWEKGGGAAKKYAVEGTRVYQQSQGQNWVSYPLLVRKRGVSSYQFRAPAEWFAELYAAYYMDKLSDSHPDAAWLKDEVHEPQDA
jgi:hypothetical protein